ncbi:MAG: PilZ domain-containing protein [Clostridiales bacterium]|nr:PilZ domain-containing protein [Clostridiales bacterium]
MGEKKSPHSGTERRRYPRVMVPVVCRMPGGKAAQGRRVSNLSRGGVRVYSDERMVAGQVVELEFLLPHGPSFKARARVVWIKDLPPESPGVYDVGLEFVRLSKKVKKELSQVLKSDK